MVFEENVIKLSELFPESFHSLWKSCRNPNIVHIVEKGGRNSGKSSDIAIAIVQLIMRYPVNAICYRKIDKTVEKSIYEQIKWAIKRCKVSSKFKILKSPMRVIYTPRGNQIDFQGAMDPERTKSLVNSEFPYAIAWLEELAEFKDEDEVTTITNSIIRAELPEGLQYKIFYSYNPPKRRHSWVNKKYNSSDIPPNTSVHHSTYADNPYVAKAMVEEAESIKKRNPLRYRWEYEGEAIGSGVVPFPNLEIIKGLITDEMVDNFDNLRYGLDFGYATDPLAFVVWHYDKKRNSIYALDEIYQVQLGNRQFAEELKRRKYDLRRIITDVEPRTVATLKNEHGISNISMAKKGPDSVEFGEKWLAELDNIYIDPLRTPNIAKEFESIDYAVDRDGNSLPRLADLDNHTIDATRYAFNDDMKPKKDKQADKDKLRAIKSLGL